MKVGIIGYGFVGRALASGIKKNTNIIKIDPSLKTNVSDLVKFEPDICFICVPTPMNKDGSQDISILKSVVEEISESKLSSLIVIKSTVLPNYINLFENKLPELIFNPEFLRERHAKEDFINSKIIILGGQSKSTALVAKFYRDYTLCKTTEYHFTDLVSASLVKYAINTFLATKVIFFNELHEIFKKSGSTEVWEKFVKMISVDKRIGSSHMQVPGIDDRLGFGGPCFPKDCNALIKYSEDIYRPFELLKKTREINNKIRRKYKKLDKREIEQNINYDD
jgi:UDPglucose 6-dehydrogenase